MRKALLLPLAFIAVAVVIIVMSRKRGPGPQLEIRFLEFTNVRSLIFPIRRSWGGMANHSLACSSCRWRTRTMRGASCNESRNRPRSRRSWNCVCAGGGTV